MFDATDKKPKQNKKKKTKKMECSWIPEHFGSTVQESHWIVWYYLLKLVNGEPPATDSYSILYHLLLPLLACSLSLSLSSSLSPFSLSNASLGCLFS